MTVENIMKLADAYKDAAESQTYMDQSGSMYQWKVAKEKAEESREALRAALTEALAPQPVREPSCDTCKHCTVASQDSFEETCFVCSHYYDSKYEVKT